MLKKEKTINPEKISYISGNGNSEKILYVSGNGTFLYFRKWKFLILRESYIQNPSIFRTRRIFGTLVYLEPGSYSEHCQTVLQK